MNGLKIGNLTARIPVIQGGMGVGISLSETGASAVANEGGVGVISCAGLIDLQGESKIVHGVMYCGSERNPQNKRKKQRYC